MYLLSVITAKCIPKTFDTADDKFFKESKETIVPKFNMFKKKKTQISRLNVNNSVIQSRIILNILYVALVVKCLNDGEKCNRTKVIFFIKIIPNGYVDQYT